MLKRESYLNQIRPFIDKNIVKVLTGIRRCGKSVMLQVIKAELLNKGIEEKQILMLNFEDLENEHLMHANLLHDYIIKLYELNSQLRYIFFDEIQEVAGWERCVNSLLAKGCFDLYITGSNAKLLSGELATYLTGRFVEIRMQTLSFQEFIAFNHNASSESIGDSFNRYLKVGGFPFIQLFIDDQQAINRYLKDIYNSVLIRDVIKRNNFRDVDLLQRIIMFVIAHVGETFSANSIANYFKSEGRKVAPETVLNQLKACEDAFLFHRVERMDLIGKQLLQVNEKFYLADHGIRQAVYGNNQRDIQRLLENIVYNELIRKGYQVFIGKQGDFEVDFCGVKDNGNVYVQVTYLLASDETINREFRPLLAINDNYPKYVLSMDQVDFSQQGIKHYYLPKFLLDNDL